MATLKISDLSVGDWVKASSVAKRVHGIEYQNGAYFVNFSDPDTNSEDYIHAPFIEPIPITAEMLGKNGWSTDGMYAFLRIDEHLHLEYYYHEHRLRKYYCGVDEWQNHAKVTDITFVAHCYSVHQLQHALMVAGVDKEINL